MIINLVVELVGAVQGSYIAREVSHDLAAGDG